MLYVLTSPTFFFRLTSGTTWHSAGMVNSLKGTVTEGAIFAQSLKLLAQLEEETGFSPGYKNHGGLTLTSTPKRLHEFR